MKRPFLFILLGYSNPWRILSLNLVFRFIATDQDNSQAGDQNGAYDAENHGCIRNSGLFNDLLFIFCFCRSGDRWNGLRFNGYRSVRSTGRLVLGLKSKERCTYCKHPNN